MKPFCKLGLRAAIAKFTNWENDNQQAPIGEEKRGRMDPVQTYLPASWALV